MDTIWVVAFIIAVIVAFFFMLMYFRCTTVMVRPDECPGSTGAYGIDPGVTSTPLKTCGVSQNDECVFSPATLKEAIEICDSMGDKCWAFTYSDSEMRVVSYNERRTVAPATNMFLKRVNTVNISGGVI